jgi:hypothetical protein
MWLTGATSHVYVEIPLMMWLSYMIKLSSLYIYNYFSYDKNLIAVVLKYLLMTAKYHNYEDEYHRKKTVLQMQYRLFVSIFVRLISNLIRFTLITEFP